MATTYRRGDSLDLTGTLEYMKRHDGTLVTQRGRGHLHPKGKVNCGGGGCVCGVDWGERLGEGRRVRVKGTVYSVKPWGNQGQDIGLEWQGTTVEPAPEAEAPVPEAPAPIVGVDGPVTAWGEDLDEGMADVLSSFSF